MPYANRKDLYKAQRAHRDRNKQKLLDYLLGHSCVDCGEKDPIVLDFDHVRGDKKYNISRAVSGSTRSWDLILKEIEKCEVRCSNCHRRVTAQRSEWSKFLHQKMRL